MGGAHLTSVDDVTISRLKPGDAAVPDYARLRCQMWEMPDAVNEEETANILDDQDDWAVFIACAPEAGCVGFLEVWLREYAEGASSSPVGYLEGWYVEEKYRCQGVGRLLVAAAEDWARSRGCTEMASDSELDNVGAIRAHHQLGYQEVTRIVCFLKPL
jgi:aminoglycoside 6'-N-acetyltransferase I